MPEATMDEDRGHGSVDHDVRRSGQDLHVVPWPKAHAAQSRTHDSLWPGVAPLDAAHQCSTLRSIEDVRHDVQAPGSPAAGVVAAVTISRAQ